MKNSSPQSVSARDGRDHAHSSYRRLEVERSALFRASPPLVSARFVVHHSSEHYISHSKKQQILRCIIKAFQHMPELCNTHFHSNQEDVQHQTRKKELGFDSQNINKGENHTHTTTTATTATTATRRRSKDYDSDLPPIVSTLHEPILEDDISLADEVFWCEEIETGEIASVATLNHIRTGNAQLWNVGTDPRFRRLGCSSFVIQFIQNWLQLLYQCPKNKSVLIECHKKSNSETMQPPTNTQNLSADSNSTLENQRENVHIHARCGRDRSTENQQIIICRSFLCENDRGGHHHAHSSYCRLGMERSALHRASPPLENEQSKGFEHEAERTKNYPDQQLESNAFVHSSNRPYSQPSIKLSLIVDTKNMAALAFYFKHNFQIVANASSWKGTTQDSFPRRYWSSFIASVSNTARTLLSNDSTTSSKPSTTICLYWSPE